ncbi:MAG: hypothetical protein HKP30_05290 [Myxococcales bacterium]|nr:hypothetical protein [Myxococcales bacterium]
MIRSHVTRALCVLAALAGFAPPAFAEDPALVEIQRQLAELAEQNAELRQRIGELENAGSSPAARTMLAGGVELPEGKGPGLFADVDFLYWRVHQPALEYGITDIGGVQDRGAVGAVLEVGEDYAPAVRASLGWRTRDAHTLSGPDFKFTYTGFHDDASDSRIGSLRSVFVSADNAENDDSDNINTLGVETVTPDDRATSATALASFDYDVFDLEMGQWFQLNESIAARLGGGARAAVIDSNFQVTYTGGDFQVPFRPFRESEFKGGGGFLSSGLLWNVWRGLAVDVKGKAGLALGRMKTRTFIPDDEPGVPTDVSFSDTRMLPFTEVGVSLSYEQALPWFVLAGSFGYEFVNWFNLSEERQFTDTNMEGMNSNLIGDIGIDGLFVRLGGTF